MSATSRTDANSIRAVRGLLERNLLERAVALAEARWPGSGPVVELVHEWAVLSPSARRERLAAIGPEDLARLRGLAKIQPDLERVLSDLEARGILPPESVAVPDPVDANDTQPPTFNEAVVDAAIDYTAQGAQLLARSVQEKLPPNLQASLESADAADATAIAAAAAALVQKRAAIEPVPMPDLDLGLPTVDEFISDEAERRRKANEAASKILERARTQVDNAADRLLSATAPIATSLTIKPEPVIPTVDAETSEPEPTHQSTRVDAPADNDLRSRIEREHVIVLEDPADRPTSMELQAVANEAGRSYVEFSRNAMNGREFFGGLTRAGKRVEPEAGAFPTAVSQRNQVVVRGRMLPKTIERLRDGYCDIPGTQATVRVHPECRIIILPS